MSSKWRRRPGGTVLQIVLWMGALWSVYAILVDAPRLLREDSANYDVNKWPLFLDIFIVMLFAGMAATFLFAIGTVRTKMARKRQAEQAEQLKTDFRD